MPVLTIQCPHCRRTLEADETQRGRRLRCPYPDCRKLFRWREDGSCVPEAEPPRVSPAGVQLIYRNWQTEPPPRRWNASSTAADESSETTTALADEEAVSLEDLRDLGLPLEKLRTHSRVGLWTALFFLGLVGITVLVGWLAFRAERAREPYLAEEAKKLFREGQYSQALTKFRDLLRQYPGSARRGEYAFYEHACLLRALLSNPRVDILRLAQTATQFLRDYRRTPHFEEHRRDLAEVLYQVAHRSIAEAKTNLDPLLLEQVREIYDALQNIGFGLGDPTARSNELAQAIKQTDYAIRLAEARNRVQLAIQAALRLQRPSLVAQTQELFARLANEFPELGQDEALRKPLGQLAELESSWLVHISPWSWQAALDWIVSSEGVPSLPWIALFDCWFPHADAALQVQLTPVSKGQKSLISPSPPVALSRGDTLVALHGDQGRVVWTATMPGEPTLQIIYRETTAPVVYLWAAERRVLAALEAQQGRVLWSLKMPRHSPFQPHVCPPYWWLPEPRGWVWYGDTQTGQVLGVFGLDYPLTTSFGTDALTQKLAIATRQKRVFLLDPQGRRAQVFMMGHEDGSLAGQMVVLPSALLLPVAQGEQMQLVGLITSTMPAAAPSAQPLLRWPGRRITHLLSNGEAAALITDRREIIWVQGASHPGAWPQILGRSKWTLNLPAVAAKTEAPPVYLLGERLGAWWLASPGVILRVHWDDYREQLRQESYPLPAGDFLDLAWDTGQPGRFLLLIREPGGSPRALAFDIAKGSVVWNRVLAFPPAGKAAPKSP
ncbi:MAG: PQQ-binding-like beta-propeller repeat protein [Gemmatales bacterium]|nr:PQQ-binding-like beta-propeller repeat protein [Gemmatales bacterium]